jgi:hypothetical protein
MRAAAQGKMVVLRELLEIKRIPVSMLCGVSWVASSPLKSASGRL